MNLADLAGQIKRDAEAARKAVEAEQRAAESRLRKIAYYEQHGDHWLVNLADQVKSLCESFNEIAGDQILLSSCLNAESAPIP